MINNFYERAAQYGINFQPSLAFIKDHSLLITAVALTAIFGVVNYYKEAVAPLLPVMPSVAILSVTIITAVALTAIAGVVNGYEEAELKEFEGELNVWQNDPLADGSEQRAAAAQLILSAFKEKHDRLELSGLRLRSLPNCIGRLTSLDNLDLRGNQLRALPESFGNLSSLQYLCFFGNQLARLPESFGSLSSLQKLGLGYNQLEALPESFGNLSSLQELGLGGNQLEALPESFGNLSSLKELDLCGNQLTVLPENFGSLSSLQKLGLGYNQLTVFPESFGSLSSLQKLGLCGNQLEALPESFGNLSSLKELDLCRNQLTVLPENFGSLSSLQKLGLGYNQLTVFPESFGSLSSLQKLGLCGNQLEALPESFGNLSSLKELDLCENQLTSLPSSIGSCRDLRAIDISYNPQFRELPLSLRELPRLNDIRTEHTAIDPNTADPIRAMFQRLREQESSNLLPSLLNLGSLYAKLPAEALEFIATSFTDSDKGIIGEWLTRLAKAKDFSSNQTKLAQVVCEILQDLRQDSFKELALNQMRENNDACGDRAAMAFNELYVSWRLLCHKEEASFREDLILLQSAGRTLALREALSQQIDAYQRERHETIGESVEIYLYYETTLREELKLLTSIQSMLYSSIGKRNWINEQELTRQVQMRYRDQVIQLPIFDTILNKDATACEELNHVVAPFTAELEALMDAQPADADPQSDAVLNWQYLMGDCGSRRKEAVAAFKVRWFGIQIERNGLAVAI